ncbi:putative PHOSPHOADENOSINE PHOSPHOSULFATE reductase [Xylariomycetidae sp. FL0641]|nr:putative PHOSPHOADENOSINE PHOSPHOSULFATE reductase [Xylariomycetidae sp. FL0641]
MSLSEDPESGYTSSDSRSDSPAPAARKVFLSQAHLDHLNAVMENMEPQEILRICTVLFPRLYQTTAFGLSGLVTLDMLAKLREENPDAPTIDLVFLDTLYHFKETLDLVERVKERYSYLRVHVFKPLGCETAADFEAKYGEKLWETNAEQYDYLAKVEPQQRSYETLDIAAVLTGRRRSQAARNNIPVIEIDEERGVIKINPMVKWSFDQVRNYIKEHDVPYNALLDRGYKSVGDWHSTEPVAEGEDERAGRWKGQDKTECGIHNKKSRYAEFLKQMQQKQEQQEAAAAAGSNDALSSQQSASQTESNNNASEPGQKIGF